MAHQIYMFTVYPFMKAGRGPKCLKTEPIFPIVINVKWIYSFLDPG